MKLILRDDDLSYFATPQQLEQVFAAIWDKRPIHFATIPFIGEVYGAKPVDNKVKKRKPISENKALVRYIKQKIKEGKIIIWQHGYSHEDCSSGYELENTDYNLLFNNLKKGKEHLEKTFGVVVDTLVPPHDRISKQGINAAVAAGFTHICRGFAPLPREIQWNKKYLLAYRKLILFWLKNGRSKRYPRELDFGSHKEIYSYRISSIDPKQLDQLFLRHKDGVLAITTHYRTMNIFYKENLLYLLSKL